MNTFSIHGATAHYRVRASALSLLLGCVGMTFAVWAEEGTATRRLPDGHPDFNGVWVVDEAGFVNPQFGPDGSVLCIVGCPRPKSATPSTEPPAAPRLPARPKYKPEFVAKVQDLDKRQVETDPALRCVNPGLPRIGPPSAIVQTQHQVVFLYEDLNGSFFRMIPTDGRKHRANAEQTYLGDAVGKWEGDTLVIESVNFVEDTWLTDDGAFHTSGLKVVERIRRVGDKLEYLATAHDPAVLAEPWQLRPRLLKLSDQPLNEPVPCIEQDLSHVVDGTHHDNPR